MAHNDHIAALLQRYVEHHVAHRERLDAEQLCVDSPELVPELRSQIDEYHRLEAALGPAPASGDGTLPSPPPRRSEPVTTEDPLLGTVVSHFRIEAVLGRGGMGIVYRASDTRLGRPVALKLLPPAAAADPSARARFLREAKAVSRLDHRNVGTLYDVGEHEGQPFLAMALYEGETLAARLASRGRLEIDDAIAILRQATAGLEAAHRAGIVHRDVKPGNLMLTASGEVKILDFGLAKWGESAAPMSVADSLTVTGAVLGTVMYMSPEQVRGEPADARSDLWALGAVAYELLTAQSPFGGGAAMAVLTRILTEEPQPLRDLRGEVPDTLDELVNGLLRKDPEERPQSASEVTTALSRAAKEVETALPEVAGRRLVRSRAVRGRKRVRPSALFSRAAMATAVGVVSVSLAGIAAWRLDWFGSRVRQATAGVNRGAEGVTIAQAGIVLLPCRVHGPPDLAYLGDALPATMSSLLAEIGDIDVRLPPKSVRVDPATVDVGDVAALYGVKACLTCSVVAEGSDLVLDVQLVEASSSRVLWGRQYRGPVLTFLKLGRDAALGVASVVAPAAEHQAGTDVVPADAEMELQRGRYYSSLFNNRHQPEDFQLALASLERAAELDPAFAAPHAEIALLRLFELEGHHSEGDPWAEIEKDARRALVLDARDGIAWGVLSAVEFERAGGSPQESLRYAVRGAAYAGTASAWPHHAQTNALDSVAMSLSIPTHREAIRLDPYYLQARLSLALKQLYFGDFAAALVSLDELARLEPELVIGRALRPFFLLPLGRSEEASEGIDRLATLVAAQRVDPLFESLARDALALKTGSAREESAATARLLAWARDPSTSTHDLSWGVVLGAPALAESGNAGGALTLLEIGRKRGYAPADWLLLNPRLARLRGDARFEALADAAREQALLGIAILDEAHARGELPSYLIEPVAKLRRDLEASRS